jgi:hypothetical protein
MTDSLPVACCPSEQRLFLTHFLFFALYRFTLLCSGKGDNDDDDEKVDADFLTHSLLLSCTRQVANPTRVRECVIMNNCFSLTLFVLQGSQYHAHQVGPGHWVGLGHQVWSG